MHSKPGAGAYLFAKHARPPLELAARGLLDIEISGREHVPDEGPYIVTANHLSLIDPVLVTMAVRRLIRFLALDELFGASQTLDRMMFYFGSIPVSRERAPLGAMYQALRVLEDGDVLGIFPEGARALYWGERTIKRGAAWLSIATGAPILPCSVIGTEGTLSLAEPRVRVPTARLVIHPKIESGPYLDSEDPLSAIMDEWVRAIDSDIGHWIHKE